MIPMGVLSVMFSALSYLHRKKIGALQMPDSIFQIQDMKGRVLLFSLGRSNIFPQTHFLDATLFSMCSSQISVTFPPSPCLSCGVTLQPPVSHSAFISCLTGTHHQSSHRLQKKKQMSMCQSSLLLQPRFLTGVCPLD